MRRAVARLGVGGKGHTSGAGRAAGARSQFVRSPRTYAQRVSVKARVVRLNPTRVGAGMSAKGARAVGGHIGYLKREGVDLDGEKPDLYNQDGTLAREQTQAWVQEAGGDRHQFRFIISPENGQELELTDFTERLVKQMEQDLGTRLQWVAVNHYDTDKPHVHLTVRGVDEKGADLVIGRDYISHGLRGRASELATEDLGPRTEHEIRQTLSLEIDAERYTSIDRGLLQLAEADPDALVDLRVTPEAHRDWAVFTRGVQLQRLEVLQHMGLAVEHEPGVWGLHPDLVPQLRQLGARGDIIKTLHQHMHGLDVSEHVIFNKEAPPAPTLTGVVQHKGLVNELYDSKYLVLNATDGRAYYVALGRYSEVDGLEAAPGNVVTVAIHEPNPLRPADKNIATLARANGGIYDPAQHLAQARGRALPDDVDPQAYVDAHVRRLQALEKRGLVRALGDGKRWDVPANLEAQVEDRVASSRDKGRFIQITREDRHGLDQQVQRRGVTYLDRELARQQTVGTDPPRGARRGLQPQLDAALKARLAELQRRGLTEPTGAGGQRLRSNALQRLYEQDLEAAEARLSREFGEPVRWDPKLSFRGTVARLEHLDSGPHVVVSDGKRFTLAPYQRGAERHLDKPVRLAPARGAKLDLAHPFPGPARLMQIRAGLAKKPSLPPTS